MCFIMGFGGICECMWSYIKVVDWGMLMGVGWLVPVEMIECHCPCMVCALQAYAELLTYVQLKDCAVLCNMQGTRLYMGTPVPVIQ